MLRGGLVKRAGSHHDGVCRCPEEPHNETVRFVESADIASPRFAGDFVTDYTVNRAHEVADHIGPLGAGWREPQIAAVSNSQFLRRTGCLGLSRRSINVRMVSGKGHSSGGVRVSADPQAGIMVTGNRPTALVDVTIASVFAAASTTSPLRYTLLRYCIFRRCACMAQRPQQPTCDRGSSSEIRRSSGIPDFSSASSRIVRPVAWASFTSTAAFS